MLYSKIDDEFAPTLVWGSDFILAVGHKTERLRICFKYLKSQGNLVFTKNNYKDSASVDSTEKLFEVQEKLYL